MPDLESFGENSMKKEKKIDPNEDPQRKINRAIYQSRQPYYKDYYKKNRETILKRSTENQKNPIKREEANETRRKRRQISKGIK